MKSFKSLNISMVILLSIFSICTTAEVTHNGNINHYSKLDANSFSGVYKVGNCDTQFARTAVVFAFYDGYRLGVKVNIFTGSAVPSKGMIFVLEQRTNSNKIEIENGIYSLTNFHENHESYIRLARSASGDRLRVTSGRNLGSRPSYECIMYKIKQ
jgi:hypothetical protein